MEYASKGDMHAVIKIIAFRCWSVERLSNSFILKLIYGIWVGSYF